MSSINAQVAEDAVSTFWDYLTTHDDLKSFGFTFYKQTDGNLFPVGADGSVNATSLPALVIESVGRDDSIEDKDDQGRQSIDNIVLEIAAIFGPTSPGLAFDCWDCDQAIASCKDIIGSTAARNGALCGNSPIEWVDFKAGRVQPVPSVANAAIVMLWVGRFTVTIRTQITYP